MVTGPMKPVLAVVRCPSCHGRLRMAPEALACASCGLTCPVVDGIPVLVLEPSSAEHDEIEHHIQTGKLREARHDHKAEQAAHFDLAVAEEFETIRPHGAPALYSFFLLEKCRRATAAIRLDLPGILALTVCGGSGMDAEFLARAGARVVSSDISLGAARRTRERARRYGLEITAVVADVEHLPFADRSFDLVLVHDGLHHLEEPEAGLAEMARVARRWVSITEPARAAATAIAVRAGLAVEREDAGNRVARLSPTEIGRFLSKAGFHLLLAQRYAMYYRHQPGSWFQALSRPAILPFVRAAWRAANALFGRAGNKMVVIAERTVPAENEISSAPQHPRE